MVVILALLAGFALPVTAVQIPWINLITGITLGLALAFEPTEPGTMARPPRRRDAPILSGGLVWHVVLVAMLFLAAVFGIFSYAVDRGYPVALAQAMAMNTLVVLEIFHQFFVRNIHSTSLTWAAARGTKVIWRVSSPSPSRSSRSPTCRPPGDQASATTPGLFHAFGFSGHGFQLGPGVGDVMAELITTGWTETPLHDFRIERFVEAPCEAQ
ncbi:hypothetical protein ASD02_25470 [Ensifer sp. Root1252]|nr:hypothetical protein ASD02_25470 [Ensifer sp. Root1252]KRC79371.1 hypothetical protein ASE32_26005 [Ensifer sp. Root231]KRC99763.1 hypothetical protein ASE47_26365 [Ensifer sp. Root258]